MFSSNALLVATLVKDRERAAARAAWIGALLREANPVHDRRHSLRQRIGFSLIQAGRALLRHGPAYSTTRRGVA
jgi:hypothetical protein